MGRFDHAVFSGHACEQMEFRGIVQQDVEAALAVPDHVTEARTGRVVVEKVLTGKHPMLLRVFVDVDCTPPVVVTVYRTGKLDKYWRQ